MAEHGGSSRTSSGARAIGVIAYLVQERHSSYGRNSLSLLKQSVTQLFEYYNARQHDPLMFFHTGNFSAEGQQQILELCGDSPATFVELNRTRHWTVPADVDSAHWRLHGHFSAGYRHMCRFFLMGIWELVAEAGYEFLLRMDEDSFLWSPIRYNLFHFMSARQLNFGYRLVSDEQEYSTKEMYHSFVKDYALRSHLESDWLLESCAVQRMANYSLANCGPPRTTYNNFYIARVGFWLSPDVQAFLRHIDRSRLIYTMRAGDHIWSFFVLRLFERPDRVHLFDDFAYEHITRSTHPSTFKQWVGRTFICLKQGGFAIGNSSIELDDHARARIVELFHPPQLCEGVDLCVHDPERAYKFNTNTSYKLVGQPLGYFMGRVSAEQLSCHAYPTPYHCRLPTDQRKWSSRGASLADRVIPGLWYDGSNWSHPTRVPSWEQARCRLSPTRRPPKPPAPWPVRKLKGCTGSRGNPTPQTCMDTCISCATLIAMYPSRNRTNQPTVIRS